MSLSISTPNGKTIKISFKKLLFPLLLFVTVIIILFKFSELKEIGRLFAQAKWHWLALAFGSQLLNFLLQGSVYQTTFKILNFPKFPLLKLIKSSITIIFLNYIIPSLGIAGNLYFLKILKKHNVKEGKALMSIIIETTCYYLSFACLLILSLIYLFFKLGHIGQMQKNAIGGFILILLLIAFAIYFFLGSKNRARKRVTWVAEKIDLFEDGIRQEERVRELLNDFYQDFDWLKKNKKKILLPALLQLTKFLSDALTIFLIFLAFGSKVSIGLGIAAFVFGRLFGLVSFIPGGLGAFEGSMVLIFNSLGHPLELALSVILVYRFFSFWLYFPLGVIFYKQLNKDSLVSAAHAE